jgi:UDP-2,3-diacylglucosamine pyrophosphatase LpxH
LFVYSESWPKLPIAEYRFTFSKATTTSGLLNYLQQETGVQLHHDRQITQIGNKMFFLAHGDGLGPGDTGYKFMKKIFRTGLTSGFSVGYILILAPERRYIFPEKAAMPMK